MVLYFYLLFDKSQRTRHTAHMNYDVVIIGAGAAGLFCAAEAGKRGKSVLLIDHAKKVGDKIRISGGGRFNFTNLHCSPAHFLSQNPHFAKSALKRYTQHDFIEKVEKAGIAYHEKTLGQLFCDGSSQQIIDMLVEDCEAHGVEIKLQISVNNITKEGEFFNISSSLGELTTSSLVIATGGLSIPKMGATDFGYRIAKQFDIPLVPTRAALVPFTFEGEVGAMMKSLSGVSLASRAKVGKSVFDEGMLFTHKGLSGPSILQISSYWEEGKPFTLNMLPEADILDLLKSERTASPKKDIQTALSEHIPKRLAAALCEQTSVYGQLADLSNTKFEALATYINGWILTPDGTEGYRTAEVTLGGIDTNALSSKTMECRTVKGLYFIGEVVDVTGHLGGFNFQWAWSSAYACGQAL